MDPILRRHTKIALLYTTRSRATRWRIATGAGVARCEIGDVDRRRQLVGLLKADIGFASTPLI
jgi:hypothetical protein